MRLTVLALSAALLAPLTAAADQDYAPPVTDPLVKKECGECHVIFQPAFLPKSSWRKMMATLPAELGRVYSVRYRSFDHPGDRSLVVCSDI